jgi:TolB-like protein
MTFFAELKRRNVFRATLAYAVFAWLLLQVVEFVLEVVGSPDWVLRVLVVLALAGLPAVAIFAWAFEITPEGVKREKDVDRSVSQRPETGQRLNQITLVSVVMLVAFLVADWFFVGEQAPDETVPLNEAATGPESARGTESMPADTASRPPPETTEEDPRIGVAVLPFTNMSPDPDNEYFADGISEELLNVLVDIEGLRVPSRTSSFSFKDTTTDMRTIAEALDVDHVLEGSVRKSGNQVRITAQLIDVSTDTHLWSEAYDRQLEDIFAVQDEIAGHIVEALKLTLDLEAKRPPRLISRPTRCFSRDVNCCASATRRGCSKPTRSSHRQRNAIRNSPMPGRPGPRSRSCCPGTSRKTSATTKPRPGITRSARWPGIRTTPTRCSPLARSAISGETTPRPWPVSRT